VRLLFCVNTGLEDSLSGISLSLSNADKARLGENSTQNNEVFRLLVESVKDYAIFVLDPKGYVVTWNPGAQAIKGYTRGEIVGQHFSKFYLQGAIDTDWPGRELALAEKEGRLADEGWRVKKDGTVFWASVIIAPLRGPDNQLQGFAKVTRDMTERRQWDEQTQKLNKELQRVIALRTLELQKLSARLLHLQDEERRRLARELHDELGQQLMLIKMMLDHEARNKDASDLIQVAIGTVRSLSYLLHPPLIDEVGLRPALEWYVEGLIKRSKIQISLTLKPHIFPRLPKEIELTIFRIIQESLTNVYRHAGSARARVEIQRQSTHVIVRVRDYGRGLPSQVTGGRVSLDQGVGIGGMRERVRQLSGELHITRAEPGTLVEARIPIFGAV